MASQDIEYLIDALQALHISPQRPKKSVRWAPEVVDNHDKTNLHHEIRGLWRIARTLSREYDHLRHHWTQTKHGFLPEEYQARGFTEQAAVFADIIVRLNWLNRRGDLCDHHILIRMQALERMS
jgi:hypothetical protein